MTTCLVVFVSGNGSNLQAIIDAIQAGEIDCRIALVVSNKPGVFALERARKAGIPSVVHTLKSYRDQGKTRIQYDIDLAALVVDRIGKQPDIQVLAGFMHILSADYLNKFKAGSVINLHPALPGTFDGAKAIERAFTAFQEGKVTGTGVMVHRVIPQVDRGEPIILKQVPIYATDTVADLETRIHSIEHALLIAGIKLLLSHE